MKIKDMISVDITPNPRSTMPFSSEPVGKKGLMDTVMEASRGRMHFETWHQTEDSSVNHACVRCGHGTEGNHATCVSVQGNPVFCTSCHEHLTDIEGVRESQVRDSVKPGDVFRLKSGKHKGIYGELVAGDTVVFKHWNEDRTRVKFKGHRRGINNGISTTHFFNDFERVEDGVVLDGRARCVSGPSDSPYRKKMGPIGRFSESLIGQEVTCLLPEKYPVMRDKRIFVHTPSQMEPGIFLLLQPSNAVVLVSTDELCTDFMLKTKAQCHYVDCADNAVWTTPDKTVFQCCDQCRFDNVPAGIELVEILPGLLEAETESGTPPGDVEATTSGLEPRSVGGVVSDWATASGEQIMKDMHEAMETILSQKAKKGTPPFAMEEMTHSLKVRFHNGDVVEIPPPTGDDWTSKIVFDEWTQFQEDMDTAYVQDTNVKRLDGTPNYGILDIWLPPAIGEDACVVHTFLVQHEEGVRMLAEYEKRLDLSQPHVISVMKWTREIQMNNNGLVEYFDV